MNILAFDQSLLLDLNRVFIGHSAVLDSLIKFLAAYLITRRWKFFPVRRSIKILSILGVVLFIPFVGLLMSRFGGAANAGLYSDPTILGGMELDNCTIAYVSYVYAGLEMLPDFLLGMGLNNAIYYYGYVAKYPMISYLNMPNIHTLLPHLESCIHLGLAATIAYLIFLVSLASTCRKAAKQGATELERALGAGAFLSILFYGVLVGKMDPIPSGGFLADGTCIPAAFPTNQQVIWAFVVFAVAALIGSRAFQQS